MHANAAPLVAWPAFLNMAVDAGVPLQDVPAAAQFLVDNGEILYFGTRVPALRDLVILDCQWLPRLFASVISLKSSFVRDGTFLLIRLVSLSGLLTECYFAGTFEHSVLMQVLFFFAFQ